VVNQLEEEGPLFLCLSCHHIIVSSHHIFSQLFREFFGVAWIRCKCIAREGEIKCELSYNSAQYINVTYCMTCELGLTFEHT